MLNGNTLNSSPLGYGINMLETITPGIEIVLDDFNCPETLPIGGSLFYLGDYDIHEQNNGLNQVYVMNKTESSNLTPDNYNLLSRHGLGFNSDKVRGKKIRLKLYVSGINETNYHDKFDEVMGVITRETNCLLEKINGSYRAIRVVPVQNPVVTNHYNTSFNTIDVEFLSIDPFWHSFNQTEYNTTINGNANINLNNLGNTEVYGKIKININSASGLDDFKVTINNGEYWEYNELIQTGDILEYDYNNNIFYKNGIIRGYLGSGGVFEKGNNVITINGNGTYNADVEIIYNKTFI